EAGDIAAWISLRNRAMADLSPRVRTWSEVDFQSEMLSKPWWSAERSWIAIAGDLRSPDGVERAVDPVTRRSPAMGASGMERVVASVTLALREGVTATVPVVHWLLVDPAWRRRGVGRSLMSQLERAAWDDGWREIELETHAGWQAAVAFYQSIGYAPVRERSPR